MSSSMPSAAGRVVACIDSFARLTGRIVAWLTLLMMLLTCLIVILRYGFSVGYIAMQESISYLHAVVFLLGAAFTLERDGHVRVDIFYRNYTERQKAWVNGIGSLVFLLPICGFVLFSSWDYTVNAWRIAEGSPNADGIPAVFLLKTLIPLFAVLLALQGVAEVLRSLLTLTERDN